MTDEYPETRAGTDRVANYIQQSRERVLDRLEPTPAQIDRAVALHDRSIVVDLMGSVSAGWDDFGLYSSALDSYARRRLEELGTSGWEAAQTVRQEVGRRRPYELVSDPEMRRDFHALWAASGRTVGMYTTKPYTVEALARSHFVFDELDSHEKITGLDPDYLEGLNENDDHAVMYHLHSAREAPIQQELTTPTEELDFLYRNGARLSLLNWRDGFGGDQWTPDGLTDLGRTIVRRMNRLGMIPDPSHLPEEATLDVIEASEQPVVATHTGCRAVHPGYCRHRNLTDKAIRAIAGDGGLVGICRLGSLTGEYSIEMFLRHVDHAVDLVGVDHIAVSTDHHYGMALEPPELIEASKPAQYNTADHWDLTAGEQERHSSVSNPSEERWEFMTQPNALAACSWPYNVTMALLMRGYSETEVQKMIGGNFLRVAGPILNDRQIGM